jgi:enoyl-CoA hydratase
MKNPTTRKCRVVILTGSEKFFAAGADITEVQNISSAIDAHAFLKGARKVFDGLEDLEKPVIAAVSGIALGGGCELLLACDIRICAENAAEALRVGLVSKVVPVGKVLEEARSVAKKIARQPGVALWVTKDVVNAGLSLDLKSALAYEARCFEMLFDTQDQKEGMAAFVEKRKPNFKDR